MKPEAPHKMYLARFQVWQVDGWQYVNEEGQVCTARDACLRSDARAAVTNLLSATSLPWSWDDVIRIEVLARS